MVIKILSIAGSDSSGGAGIQADIKTITSLKAYAAAVITSVTVQNTTKVYDVFNIPAKIVAAQIKVVLEDIKISAIKTGMLPTKEIMAAVKKALADYSEIPLIIDPVMIATSGDKLMESESVSYFRKNILPIAYLVTPNINEAEILAKVKIRHLDDMIRAGNIILASGAKGVLIKGSHLPGREINDVLITKDEAKIFKSKRILKRNMHGSGCTLGAAIATFLGQGKSLSHSVELSRNYVHEAINSAIPIGRGAWPLKHL